MALVTGSFQEGGEGVADRGYRFSLSSVWHDEAAAFAQPRTREGDKTETHGS